MPRDVLLVAFLVSSLNVTAQQRHSASIVPVRGASVADASVAGKSATMQSEPRLSTTITSVETKIAAGDLLEIGVFDAPEFSLKSRVAADGTISVPLIGSVSVAGLVPAQAQETIARRLIQADLVRNPQVSIFVAEYATQSVYIIGEVTRPGPYPLVGAHRLLDVISAAGGLTSRAGNTVEISSRDMSAQPLTVALGGTPTPETNPELHPGDTIQVTAAGIVYVLGDVTRPGGFVLDRTDGLTVMQLLALAEGTKSTASLRNVRLIRSASHGARQEITLDLKKIFKAQSDDVAVQEGDILFVPGNLTKGAAKRGMEAILQTATGVVIYKR